MDVIFDIDGTLANAQHRLHFIKDSSFWIADTPLSPAKPDWDSFLSTEEVIKDEPIPQIWDVLESFLNNRSSRVIFITGRPEHQRKATYNWLYTHDCPVRMFCAFHWTKRQESGGITGPVIYMRSNGDRRPSHVVKRELLGKARADGFRPELVFEDRKEDTSMWREEGLICAQVAEGNY